IVPLVGVAHEGAAGERVWRDPTLVLRHGHTYSGHPTACAAALANLAILSDEELPARAPRIGERVARGLRERVDNDSVIDVRGDGAVWAIELAPGLAANDLREELLARGV